MLNINENVYNRYVEGLENEGFKAVLEILEGGSFEETLSELNAVYQHGCSIGISGFTYYSETEKFFDEYSEDILEALQEFKYTVDDSIFANLDFTKNGLTWFFVEDCVSRLINDIEQLENEGEEY